MKVESVAGLEWRAKGETAPMNAKVRFSTGKVLTTIFSDDKGAAYIDFLPKR